MIMVTKSARRYILFTGILCCAVLFSSSVRFGSSLLSIVESKKRNVTDSCIVPPFSDMDQLYTFLEKPKAPCKKMERIGGALNQEQLDGYKWVCFDRGFKPEDCAVYSFGISNEWSFDDAMDLKRHCKVFSFDPTMGAKTHNRTSRISFFNLGISNSKGSVTLRKTLCMMDTYRGIIGMLQHQNTTIDYLKMDIEGSEIAVFEDIIHNDLQLLNNIMQIGLEIHVGKADKHGFNNGMKFWNIMHLLECSGWRLLSNEINQVVGNHFSFRGTKRSTCYEVVWINTRHI